MAGLDASGLTILRQPEIVTNLQTAEQQNIHPDINTQEDELLGQLNNILSSALAEIWELNQAVYDSAILAKAEGVNLDNLAALRNVSRIAASKSFTNDQQFVGSNGTTVSIGTILQNDSTLDRFTTTSDINIQASACNSITLEVSQVLDATLYTLDVNATQYTYTSSGTATANEIMSAFQSQITADGNATWGATLNGDVLAISTEDSSTINVLPTSFISVSSVTVTGYIESINDGAVIAPANSVTTLVTGVGGVTSTTNLNQLIIGRDVETDEELRVRIAQSGGGDSTGTIPSIEAAVLNNVQGVTSVIVTENSNQTHTISLTGVTGTFQAGDRLVGGTSGSEGTVIEVLSGTDLRVNVPTTHFQLTDAITGSISGATGTISEDRPPHSYETTVVGGDNTDVAEEIWRTKPVGIQLFGNTSVNITDSGGQNRNILFTRPVALNFAVRVSYTLYAEETFPVGGQDDIINAVVAHVNSLGVGVDVITHRMFAGIYSAVPGLANITVEIQTLANPGDTPNGGAWQVTPIAVSSSQFAQTTSVDVTTVDVT